MQSSWGRPDVIRAICDVQRPVSEMSGRRWFDAIERSADRVLEHLIDLDPPGDTQRRASDGRSVWIEPTAPRFTSEAVLAQEEAIVAWAMAAQADPPAPSTTVDRSGLDVDAGRGGGLGRRPRSSRPGRRSGRCRQDPHAHRRRQRPRQPWPQSCSVWRRRRRPPAPSNATPASASDTVAKLLHEWQRTDRPPLPEYQLGPGATLIVDEAGMLSTPALHQVVSLATANGWRLALIGDPRQLQGVGRGGLLAELCANGRVDELERLHRFKHRWEAAASLLLRSGDPRAFDAYEAHGRIIAGTLDEHLARMADTWITNHQHGRTAALVASTNDHVDTINHAVQQARLDAGHLDSDTATRIAGGEHAHIGDVVATRRNDRRLTTTAGEPVRNRDTWTVTGIGDDGSLTVSHQGGHGDVTLPADYAREHVRLGYVATEHGWESDNVTAGMCVASPATTRRGLYVAVTRGSDENVICVITDSNDVAEARDVLDGIVAIDRADIPAVTQRRTLAEQQRQHAGRGSHPAVCHPGLVRAPTERSPRRAQLDRAASSCSCQGTRTAPDGGRHCRRQAAAGRCGHPTGPRRARRRGTTRQGSTLEPSRRSAPARRFAPAIAPQRPTRRQRERATAGSGNRLPRTNPCSHRTQREPSQRGALGTRRRTPRPPPPRRRPPTRHPLRLPP